MERGKLDSLNLHDEFEWDTKTIASGIKGYLSKHLGEPLLTFDFYIHFVEAASEWCEGEYRYTCTCEAASEWCEGEYRYTCTCEAASEWCEGEYRYTCTCEAASEWCEGEYRYTCMRGSSFFLEKVTALGVLCCFALIVVCLTLLASFFLPSASLIKTCICTCMSKATIYT